MSSFLHFIEKKMLAPTGAASRRLQVSSFLPAPSLRGSTDLLFPSATAQLWTCPAVDAYPVSAVAAVATATAASSLNLRRRAPYHPENNSSSPARPATRIGIGVGSYVRRTAVAPPLPSCAAAASHPPFAAAAVAIRRQHLAAVATTLFSSHRFAAGTSPCLVPLTGAADGQQRGYRHWARHRAFEKIRRLPNRALRPGCCAASLFPPSTSSSSCVRNKPVFASSASSDRGTMMAHDSTGISSDDDITSQMSNVMHTSSTNKHSGTFTGFFSPNITGSMAVHGDFRVARSSGGGFRLVPPYPPRINKTIEPYPPSAVKYYTINRSYPLQWRNVEYKYIPVRLPRPYGASTPGGGSASGQAGAAWGGDIIRIFHRRKGWKRKRK